MHPGDQLRGSGSCRSESLCIRIIVQRGQRTVADAAEVNAVTQFSLVHLLLSLHHAPTDRSKRGQLVNIAMRGLGDDKMNVQRIAVLHSTIPFLAN